MNQDDFLKQVTSKLDGLAQQHKHKPVVMHHVLEEIQDSKHSRFAFLKMSGFALKEEIKKVIEENGCQNIYKIQLEGFHDPDVIFDFTGFDVYGNVVEFVDSTKPAYDFEKLKKQNADNILGYLIDEWKKCG